MRFYRPFGARPRRATEGRTEYQGWVDQSHRTDDEEFDIPLLGKPPALEEFLGYAQRWHFYYNGKRPHFGNEWIESS